MIENLKSEEILMQRWTYRDEIVVSIRCTAYNQEKFIEQTLQGFLIQETDFPFEIVVHDDASTDKTAEIIRKYALRYPSIIKPIYETENQFSKHDGSLIRIMNEACVGKYIAFCEGDDYWIDPLKLQKQVDVLERNEKVQLVYTGFLCVDENDVEIVRPEIEEFMKISCSGDVFKQMIGRNFVMTLTVCVRRDLFMSAIMEGSPERQDYLTALVASGMGECVYLPEKTSCYRKSLNSLTHKMSYMVMRKNTMIRDYIFRLYCKGVFPRRPLRENLIICLRYFRASAKGHFILFKWRIKNVLKNFFVAFFME